ncbi:MAG TPA: cation transporter [Ignavibacteriaceae bacterium]|nr:cation transporter [Ignavibacteriaceae bacterium]HRN27549.1 cation transporter [Ignavibacteriaceae bacterium]
MKQTIKIEGMTCQHCVMAVKKGLQKLDPQNLDVKIGEATVEYDETKINEVSIKASIEEAGYKVIE